ncbi:MAG: GNAT family N-acetyltransferase [Pseudomonadota bacterium]
MNIVFHNDEPSAAARAAVAKGFSLHSAELGAPDYEKDRVSWTITGEEGEVLAVLTGDLLWDWLYIDELWVSEEVRGTGLGRKLMQLAEEFAAKQRLTGVWLWTQSWQAETFYRKLGYEEFTRFADFPRGHSRIGLRKTTPSIAG